MIRGTSEVLVKLPAKLCKTGLTVSASIMKLGYMVDRELRKASGAIG